MSPVRWLAGSLYWNPSLPRRWLWLLVAAATQTLGSWTIGRFWFA